MWVAGEGGGVAHRDTKIRQDLPALVQNYNTSNHRSINMILKQTSLSEEAAEVHGDLYCDMIMKRKPKTEV